MINDYTEVAYNVMDAVDVSYGSWDNVGDNWSISRSFDLPAGIEGTVAYVDFILEDGPDLQTRIVLYSVSKSFR